jgi:hypothetical protein
MIPDLSTVFDTINQYRYSITIGIALLYFAPLLFPVGWEMASATWQYAAAIMFFLSVGMILSRDLWPKVKQLLGIGVNKRQVSLKILKACKKEGGEPPFELEISSVGVDEEKIKDLVDGHLSHDECRFSSEQTLVVTEAGLKKLKENI